ncbi:hypothetical protein ACFVTP_15650 [Streptomyces celluloflavus]|uniref:hypothetical protein n=1 Tax=Streptomyces celluloflavus TaxID=58344 RepID=UPI0036DA5B7B
MPSASPPTCSATARLGGAAVPAAAKTPTETPAPAKEIIRDVPDIAVRSPCGRPRRNADDPESKDVRAVAFTGQ